MSDPETYQVLAVRYGTRRTTKSHMFLRYERYGEPNASIDMAYYFWVARNDRHTVLVDCGYSEQAAVSRGRTRFASPLSLLRGLGITEDMVDHLVLTHAHYDHIGNLGAFRNAEVVVAAAEYEFWSGPHAHRHHFGHTVEPADLQALRQVVERGRARLVTDETTIVPGIRVIPVGGHTPGSMVVTVQAEVGSILLASDALHFYEELELDRPSSTVANLPEMYAAYELMREHRRRQGIVVPGHDPAVAERFPHYRADPAGYVLELSAQRL